MEKYSLKQIIKLLSDRKLSEKELVKYYFSRINEYNPTLNAVVSLRNIDEVFYDLDMLKRSSSGKNRKLLGIPLAIKDLIDVEGLPTTYGVPKYKNNIVFEKQNIYLYMTISCDYQRIMYIKQI